MQEPVLEAPSAIEASGIFVVKSSEASQVAAGSSPVLPSLFAFWFEPSVDAC
jgi:hypothetical protein